MRFESNLNLSSVEPYEPALPVHVRRGLPLIWTLVDANVLEWARPFRWRLFRNQDGGLYVIRPTKSKGRQSTIYLHRAVMNAPAGSQVDHINGWRNASSQYLDNRRSNLRIATSSENAQNIQNRRRTLPRGVGWYASTGRWRAFGKLDGHAYHLGYFSTAEDAAVVAATWRASHLPYSADARLTE